MIRFTVGSLGDDPDPDAWQRLGLYVEHYDEAPRVLVATALLPPVMAMEYRRQMALLNDVLDVEEVVPAG